jgi:hypothetical protein
MEVWLVHNIQNGAETSTHGVKNGTLYYTIIIIIVRSQYRAVGIATGCGMKDREVGVRVPLG